MFCSYFIIKFCKELNFDEVDTLIYKIILVIFPFHNQFFFKLNHRRLYIEGAL